MEAGGVKVEHQTPKQDVLGSMTTSSPVLCP